MKSNAVFSLVFSFVLVLAAVMPGCISTTNPDTGDVVTQIDPVVLALVVAWVEDRLAEAREDRSTPEAEVEEVEGWVTLVERLEDRLASGEPISLTDLTLFRELVGKSMK